MKWRLGIALVGLTLVVLFVHDIPMSKYLANVEHNRLVTSLERDSFILAGNSQRALTLPTRTNVSQLERTINKYRRNNQAVIIITDSNGDVFATSDSQIQKGEPYATRPEISRALDGSVANGQRYSQTLGYEIVYVAVPILSGTKVLGAVRITYPEQTVDNIVKGRIRIIQIVALISLLVALLLALILAFGITRRLNNLEEVTNRFSDGDYDARANEQVGAREIKSLAHSFNQMAEQQTRLIDQQRAFAVDASHQLRTPLTALQLRLERVSELISSDPNAAAERLEAARLETDRLQNIVEGLLVLSRAGAQTQHELIAVDLAAVARQRFEEWEALALESGVKLQLEVPDVAFVQAIDGAVEQVIDNYLDNAFAVAPTGSSIIIKITSDTEMTSMHVLDEGPGLPESDLEKAFNRFWRLHSDVHGTGLGLAIVERLVSASGGRVQLSNRKPNGIDAEATFKNPTT